MVGGVGHTGGLTPDAEDAEPVLLIPVGLPCLERGHFKKKSKTRARRVNDLKKIGREMVPSKI